MAIKSAAELALIRESARWGNFAHRLLQRYTRVGESETVVALHAGTEATLAMLDTLGQLYRGRAHTTRAPRPAIAARSGARQRSRIGWPIT